jgi:hypothetical protein
MGTAMGATPMVMRTPARSRGSIGATRETT